jgi:hypothetical protein
MDKADWDVLEGEWSRVLVQGGALRQLERHQSGYYDGGWLIELANGDKYHPAAFELNEEMESLGLFTRVDTAGFRPQFQPLLVSPFDLQLSEMIGPVRKSVEVQGTGVVSRVTLRAERGIICFVLDPTVPLNVLATSQCP